MRKTLIVVLAVLMLLITISGATATVLYSDSFNRTNSDTVGGLWLESEPTPTSNITIYNNLLRIYRPAGASNAITVNLNITNFSANSIIEFDWYAPIVGTYYGCGISKTTANAVADSFASLYSSTVSDLTAGHIGSFTEATETDFVASYVDGAKYHIVYRNWNYAGNNYTQYVNGTAFNDDSEGTDPPTEVYFQCFTNAGATEMTAYIDAFCHYNTTGGTTYNDCFGTGTTPPSPFLLTSAVNKFNATIDGLQFNTTNGTISTSILQNSTSLHNITVSGECGEGFCNYSSHSFTNVNVSSNMQVNLSFWYNLVPARVTSVYEFESQIVSLLVNHSTSNFSHTIEGVSATLFYNGTAYTATKTNVSTTQTNFSVTFITPSIPATANMSLNWSINITRGAGASTLLTRTHNNTIQQVNKIGIDNCSTYTIVALNISLRNETGDQNLINGSLDGYFEVYISSSASYRPFNLSWGDSNNFGICIDAHTTNYSINGQLEYSASGFSSETHYFTGAELNNITDYLNLYLTQSASLVTFNVKDENDEPVNGVYITIQRWDIATNTGTTTEIIRTDTYGNAIGHIILNTQRYKFILTYEGEIELETDDTILTGTSYQFSITLGTDYFINYDTARSVLCGLSFNNNTRTFSYVFNDASGSVAQGCLDVKRFSGSTTGTMNSTCVAGSSGTITTTITNNTGTYTFTGSGQITIDGKNYVCGEPVSYHYDQRFKSFGLEGIFYGFLLIVTLVAIGLWSPVASLILLGVGFVALQLIGLFHLSWPIFVAFCIVLGLVIYKVGKQ